MAGIKPLGRQILDEKLLKADRKKCKKYGMCGVGEEALYLPGRLRNRSTYIPLDSVSYVYKRVAYSKAEGKGLLAPVLYIVVRYDGEQEKACIFRDIREADAMLEEVGRVAPRVITKSPSSVEKESSAAGAVRVELSPESEKALRSLRRDEEHLKKSPGLYENLAAMARIKRRMDLINPLYQWIVMALLLAGAALFVVGIVLRRYGYQSSTVSIMMMLVGAMLMILMVNTRILPGPVKNRKNIDRDYQRALADMEHFIKGFGDHHLPARYSHPVVISMLEDIIEEGRAETVDDALCQLKDYLRAADDTKVVSREEYERIVVVKPMFSVAGYR